MPSYGNFVLDKGYDAAAALTKCRAVKLSAEGVVTPITASTDVPVGVNIFDVTSDDITKQRGASVREAGIAEMETAGAITAGTLVTISPNGRVKAAATGERIIGMARQAASGASKRIAVSLIIPGPLSP